MEGEVPGKILQVPFVKISVEDRAQGLFEKFYVVAAVPIPVYGYLFMVSTGDSRMQLQGIWK